MTESPEISDLIRELRSRLGFTQEELAAHLKVSFPTINSWENARRKPSRMGIQIIRNAVQQMGEDGCDLLSKYFPTDKL